MTIPCLLHAIDALLAKHAAIYRDFTQKRATAYDVKGWVKNTHCGRVCAVPFYFVSDTFLFSFFEPPVMLISGEILILIPCR